jgi:hypothetical protein
LGIVDFIDYVEFRLKMRCYLKIILGMFVVFGVLAVVALVALLLEMKGYFEEYDSLG